VTLPEVVTGELAGKFGEISLFNRHADFELESASNSNSTSPWAISCEPAAQPSHVVPHPTSTPRVAPQPLQDPHGGSLFAPGRQGARTRVQLGLRHRPRPRYRHLKSTLVAPKVRSDGTTTSQASRLDAKLLLGISPARGLLEDNFSMLCSLSSSGAPHQSLLDVAHTALLSRGLHAARVLR
jgi:hypothetical protein